MTKNAQVLRRARERARAEGRCIVCRKNYAKPRCSTCTGCLARTAQRNEELRGSGLCTCGRRACDGKGLCAPCGARVAQYHREVRAEKKAAGICCWSACRSASRIGRTTCFTHAGGERARARRQAGVGR